MLFTLVEPTERLVTTSGPSSFISDAMSAIGTKRTSLTLASGPVRKFKAQKGATCACPANFPCAKN